MTETEKEDLKALVFPSVLLYLDVATIMLKSESPNFNTIPLFPMSAFPLEYPLVQSLLLKPNHNPLSYHLMHATEEDFKSQDTAENCSLTLKLNTNRNGELNDPHIYLMISDGFVLCCV